MSELQDDAFAQLERSHRRLEERLIELEEAADAIEAGRDVAQALETVRGVAAWFGRAGARHEADEEASLFPRLRAHGVAAALCEELAAQHRAQADLWAEMARLLAASELDAAALAARVRALFRSYAAHVRAEEDELFPAARAALDAAELAGMLEEMAARRGRGGGQGA